MSLQTKIRSKDQSKKSKEEESKILEKLIDLIKSEHKIHCKHPKKMHDTDPNGTVYCMKCGEDV